MVEEAPLEVMLVDDNPRRAALLETRLREAGFSRIVLVPLESGLLRQIEERAPDVIIIDLESPGRDLLESLSFVSTHSPTPIVMFTRKDDSDFIRDAVDAGVTAYVVDGLQTEKVKPVIDVALAQFRQFQRLRADLSVTRAELGERKVIDRAKTLLMERFRQSEDQAYACLRAEAMNRNLKLAELARQIVANFQPSAGKGDPS